MSLPHNVRPNKSPRKSSALVNNCLVTGPTSKGRRREFAHFGWKAEDIPDPQALATFERSRLNRDRLDDRQAELLRWTSALMHLRKTILALGVGDANRLHHSVWAVEREQVLVLHRWSNRGEAALLLFGFNQSPVMLNLCGPVGA